MALFLIRPQSSVLIGTGKTDGPVEKTKKIVLFGKCSKI